MIDSKGIIVAKYKIYRTSCKSKQTSVNKSTKNGNVKKETAIFWTSQNYRETKYLLFGPILSGHLK